MRGRRAGIVVTRSLLSLRTEAAERFSRFGPIGWRWCVAAGLVLSSVSAFARGPEPSLRIRLEPLGFGTISNRYLLEGATMLTVNYVDKEHLLVTFGVSRLMKRLADCPPDDEDRLVKGVLLELPTGRVVAEAEWRFHDLGQYLWDLGGGTFLLRQRDVLTTFTPLDSAGKAFDLHPFLVFDRRIEAIVVSANHDLLSIETMKRTVPKVESSPMMTAAAPASSTPQSAAQGAVSPSTRGLVLQRRDQPPGQEEAKPDTAPVEISFVRLNHRSSAAGPGAAGASAVRPDHITATVTGRIRTKGVVSIPLTTEGFLETKETTRDGVLFDFTTFTGKVMELGDFATSCAPKPTFVSQSEFVAFGCRGSDENLDLAGFNLRGDLIWQMNFSDIHAYPSFAAAIPAGRFALSRTLTLSNIFGSETPSMSELTGQEVRVVQMYNGKQLLRVMTSPIQRSGQNFALSPDGMALAIVHDNATVKGPDPKDTVHDPAIEIYNLPPLSGKDQKEIAAEAALAPEPANAKMRFSAEEIKAALTRKPGVAADQASEAEDSVLETKKASLADAKVVGDAAPAAANVDSRSASETGSIPASDPAPACSGLTETGLTGCPVQPKPQSAGTLEPGEIDGPRKPPTLYAPGEAHVPAANASGSSQQPQ